MSTVNAGFFNIFRTTATKNDSSDTETSLNDPTKNGTVIRLKQVPDKMKSVERATGAEKFSSCDIDLIFARIEVQVIKTLIASYFDIVKVHQNFKRLSWGN